MKIVLMDQTHVDQIVELEKACFTDPWSKQSVSYELTNPLSLWLVAVLDGTVIGYIGSQSVLGEADMMNLAVSSAFRCRGVGERLVTELIRHLLSNEVYRLTLEVRASNEPAIRLYRKLGFEQIGRRPRYYRHPQEDALIMGKELRP